MNLLLDYLYHVDPARETTDRLKWAARCGQLCTIAQFHQTGEYVLPRSKYVMVLRLNDLLTGDLLAERFVESLASMQAHDLVECLKVQLCAEVCRGPGYVR